MGANKGGQGRGEQVNPVRCVCNKLVCAVRGNVIEIKCGKCKRLVVIHTRGIERIGFRDPISELTPVVTPMITDDDETE